MTEAGLFVTFIGSLMVVAGQTSYFKQNDPKTAERMTFTGGILGALGGLMAILGSAVR